MKPEQYGLVLLEIDSSAGMLICSVCGAEPGQQCSIPDPDNEDLCIELGGWVHKQRLEG